MAKSRKPQESLADYERPPLIEVVFGVRFEPLKDWRIPHVGQFWDRIAEQFPRCEHAPPIGDTFPIEPTGLPLPRVWLISRSDDQLIQLQPGRFLFNWRRREGAAGYPRYGELSKRFFSLLGNFIEFCNEKDLGNINFLENELSYINNINEEEDLKFTEDNEKILKHPVWNKDTQKFLPVPSAMNWQATFILPDDNGALNVRATLQTHQNEGWRRYRLELSARGISPTQPLDNIQGWFSLAHEWVVRGFEDITAAEAQRKRWGRL